MMATASVARQVRRLRQARLRWKERAAAKQREIRKLRVAVRDLSASRDRWKQRYHELQRQQAAPPDPAPALVLFPHPSGSGEPPQGGL
jgi:predicted  nucleic acid-binding Zn-ribbon protein